ncbi:MAG: hypothetical protein M1814_003840 [Vezdaea aestivalis]|nr:MAG: hypothetical protein M1814_003840 [Vezdaea aestivalis]
MPPGSSQAVSKQWNPAVTTFSTIEKLTSLMRAATQDDVQVAAVLSLEQLGSRLIVTDRLISDGVDALNGHYSMRAKDTRLVFGLNWGGVASQLKDSSSGVQGFLLISALKLCTYNGQELAETLFEFMSFEGLLRDTAVSMRQFQSLISAISGHSEALLPSNKGYSIRGHGGVITSAQLA